MSSVHEEFCGRMSEAFDGLWTRRTLPASDLLGLRVVRMDELDGSARVEFHADPRFCNAMGVVQGGLLTAMLDDAMGIAGTVASGMTRLMLTLCIKTSFVRAAQPGLLIADARAIKIGSSVAFLEGTLRDGGGVLLATASATAMQT